MRPLDKVGRSDPYSFVSSKSQGGGPKNKTKRKQAEPVGGGVGEKKSKHRERKSLVIAAAPVAKEPWTTVVVCGPSGGRAGRKHRTTEPEAILNFDHGERSEVAVTVGKPIQNLRVGEVSFPPLEKRTRKY